MKKRSLLLILLSILILSTLVACDTAPREIVNISFSDDGRDYSDMEEPFYEDEQSVYIFPAIMSYDCTVYYSDGSSENIVDALKAGRATPADLDRFDILYFTHTKPDNTTPHEIIDISFSDGLVKYSDMEEPFYEDEQYMYIFPAIMSHDCTVYYSDGSRENIVDALKAGRATPADLDRFDILYFARQISKPIE